MIPASQLTVAGVAASLAPHVAARLDADRPAILATVGPLKRVLLAAALDLLAANPTLRLIIGCFLRGVIDWLSPAAPAVAAFCAMAAHVATEPQAEYLDAVRGLISAPPEPAPAMTWADYNR